MRARLVREAAYVADVTNVDALTGARLSEGASGAFLLHSKVRNDVAHQDWLP